MYPKEHFITSGSGVLAYSIAIGLPLPEIIIWTVLGSSAGVLIDIDHAILSMVIKKRFKKGLKWFRQPLKAITKPESFLDDMSYEGLRYHRIISHTVILGILFFIKDFNPLLTPVTIGVGLHLLGDIAHDLNNKKYWFQA